MGNKYSDETVKYSLICRMEVDGIVSKSDIIGAIFGQTEGLLDQDMEIKQLQKTGRIGRIELDLNNRSNRTKGTITIPSSLNKIETAIIAATIESVDRVGACSCKVELERIVDVRRDKRDQIANRAAEIMKQWDLDKQSDSVDISKIVEQGSRRGRIVSFGSEKLAAGPQIYDSHDIILVEGRADVNNLLKMNIENTIALGGTSVPSTVKNLCKNRRVTALLDGDRGGDMILKELLLSTEIDFIARAPERREIEDLSIDEVREALAERSPLLKTSFATEKFSVYDFLKKNGREGVIKKHKDRRAPKSAEKSTRPKPGKDHSKKSKPKSKRKDKKKGKEKGKKSRQKKKKRGPTVPKEVQDAIKDIKQSMGAVLMNNANEKMLTVSTAEIYDSLKSTDGIETVIIDGVITQRILDAAEEKNVKLVAGAVLGDIQNRPKETKYVTFNRI